MKKIVLGVMFAAGVASGAAASTLNCLEASARSGSLSGCLNESGTGVSEPVAVEAGPSLYSAADSLGVGTSEAGRKSSPHRVPTPTGYTDAEEGTLKAGLFNGLDSGFKSVFAAIVSPAVIGIQACGAPYASNAGTIAFAALGVLLAIPASIVAVVLGAPFGAVAGMIAEKIAPGSTDDWFTF